MASLFDARFTLVDIGAAGGAHPRWGAFGNIEIVGFEPFEAEFRKLKNSKNRRWLNIGLHQDPGTYPLHITRYPTNVSLLEPNRDVLSNLQFPIEDFDVLRSVPIPCDSLDNVCREHGLRPHALKIDTQGSELFILRGARRTLETSVFSVEVEVEFIPAYKNQPLFHEVHDFLTSTGFLLMDLGNRLHVKGRQAEGLGGPKSHWVTADALYFKALGPLERSLSSKDASLE
ncbi:MAG: FkbM family methyltransferase, partial [Elusimicrobia bacterium]|nr:FkbM family methyltransferase [Elusimicrobiota bacterium]